MYIYIFPSLAKSFILVLSQMLAKRGLCNCGLMNLCQALHNDTSSVTLTHFQNEIRLIIHVVLNVSRLSVWWCCVAFLVDQLVYNSTRRGLASM